MIWYFYSSTIMAALLCQNSITYKGPTFHYIFFTRYSESSWLFFEGFWDTWTTVTEIFFYEDINDVFQWSVLIESAIIVYFFSIYIHIIERGSRSTRGPRVYILYTTIIHVTLVNVVLVKNEWSAAQTRVDSKTSVTVYTILEHLQVSHAHVWHLF